MQRLQCMTYILIFRCGAVKSKVSLKECTFSAVILRWEEVWMRGAVRLKVGRVARLSHNSWKHRPHYHSWCCRHRTLWTKGATHLGILGWTVSKSIGFLPQFYPGKSNWKPLEWEVRLPQLWAPPVAFKAEWSCNLWWTCHALIAILGVFFLFSYCRKALFLWKLPKTLRVCSFHFAFVKRMKIRTTHLGSTHWLDKWFAKPGPVL